MGLELEYADGQTPLDEEEKEGLLIPTITTQRELDEFEQQNIEQAVQWSMSRSVRIKSILTETFIRQVHKRMYGEVWLWAGEFRRTKKNLGVDSWQIAAELRYLLDDTRYWLENNTYTADEAVLRLKHRLVSIHCFPNGNGRHSRLMADIMITKIFRRPVFSWGSSDLSGKSDKRAAYLSAIKAADHGDFQLLLEFARS